MDTVIDIFDDENVEHKEMHPYVPPQVQTADEIELETQLIDDNFAQLKAQYDQINDVATEQRKEKKITNLADDIIDESNPFQNLGTEAIWLEEDIFDNDDQKSVVDISKDILKGFKENDSFLDFSILTEAIIDDLFNESDTSDNEVTVEDVTDNESDNDVTLEDVSDNESDNDVTLEDIANNVDPELIIAEPAEYAPVLSGSLSVAVDNGVPQNKKYITTRLNSAVAAANKIKNTCKDKYQRKIIGKTKPKFDIEKNKYRPNRKIATPNIKKIPKDWLKAAGYLDTKDQDSIRYVYKCPPKPEHKAATDTGHYIRSEIDNVDLKEKTGQKNYCKKYCQKVQKNGQKNITCCTENFADQNNKS